MKESLILSTLPKTWIFDLDGTLVKHNGYKDENGDVLLEGVQESLSQIPEGDTIIILTSRTEEYREQTLQFLQAKEIRYDEILFDMPVGERILINDRKPSGLDTALAFNLERDCFQLPEIIRQK